MMGNVAQVFLDDGVWATTLEQLHAALQPGGHLAFESRKPDAQEWMTWRPDTTREEVDTPWGRLQVVPTIHLS